MRPLPVSLVTVLAALVGCEQSGSSSADAVPTTQAGSISVSAPLVQTVSLDGQAVEIGCAMCIYEMPGADRCMPAIVINGEPLLVTGLELDLHEHDLCSNAGHAVVTGKVVDGQVVATSIEF